MFGGSPTDPRSMAQNSEFWALMAVLAGTTGKTPVEMKPIVVERALGERKGTSKLTVAEMDKVIAYVRDCIKLFAPAGAKKEGA